MINIPKPLLPTGWADTKLINVLPLNYGKALSEKNRNANGSYAVFGSSGIVGKHDSYIAEGPCIIVGRKGSAGSVFYSQTDCWPIDTAYYTVPDKNLDLKYFYYLLCHIQLDQNDNSTAIPSLSRNVYNQIFVPVAPLNEQKRIADKIDTLFGNLDEGETLLRTVQKQLASYRRSVLRAAVTGELTKEWREKNKHRAESGASLLQRILESRRKNWKGRGKYQEPLPPNYNNLPNLPKGWIWISPDQVSLMFGNGLSKKPANYETKYPILRISAVRPMSVDASDIRFYEPINNEKLENFWVEKGDLLFTRYNGSGHLVGVCGLYNSNQRILHPDKIIKLRTIDLGDSGRKYLELCLNAGESRAFIKRHVKTTAGQQGIAGSDLKLTPIPLAPPEEQIEIVNIVEEKLAQIDVLENWCETELKRSSRLRQSILKSAFSGKFVPQDPADEPASTLLARIQSVRAQLATTAHARQSRKSKASEAA